MAPGGKGGIRGSASSPPKNLSEITLTAYKNLPERDDDLDDHDLNDEHVDPESEGKDSIATSSNKGVQQPKNKMGATGMKKLGVVANAIASCAALSFFSISMILVNKVRLYRFISKALIMDQNVADMHREGKESEQIHSDARTERFPPRKAYRDL